MTLRSRLTAAASALMGKAAPSGGGYGRSTGGTYFADAFNSRPAPTLTQLAEGYRAIIYACANLNAQGVSRCPLRVYSTTTKARGEEKPGRGLRAISRPATKAARLRLANSPMPGVARAVSSADEVDEITDHPILDALDSPNPEMDRLGLLYYVALAMDILGTAYVEPQSAMGLPSGFWPLQSQYVLPSPSPGSAIIKEYTYFGRTYRADELIRFRLMSLSNPYGPGYSPAQAAWEYAGIEEKYSTLQDQLLGMGPRPSMIGSAKDPNLPPGPDERARFERDLNSKFSGPNAAGRILLTDGMYDFKQLSYNPSDIQNTGVSEYTLTRIANIFGVPPSMLSTDTNLANFQAAKEKHADAIEFRCHAIAWVLTTLAKKTEPRLIVAFDPPNGEDEERTAKVVSLRLASGLTTINEERHEQGFDDVEWGKEPWLASTLRQPSEERPDPAAGLLGPDGKPAKPKPKPGEKPKDKPKPKPTKAVREVGASDPFGPETDETWEATLVGARRMLKAALAQSGQLDEYAAGSLTFDQRREVAIRIGEMAGATLKAQFQAYLDEFGPVRERAIFGKARQALDSLFGKAKKLVYRAVLAGTLALVGPTEVNPDLQAAVVVESRRQVQFLQGFHQAVVLGQQPLDGTFADRGSRYGSSYGPGMNAAKNGLDGERWVEERRLHSGMDIPCSDCVEEAGKGWSPRGSLRPIGDSECHDRCHCHFDFRDADGVEYWAWQTAEWGKLMASTPAGMTDDEKDDYWGV